MATTRIALFVVSIAGFVSAIALLATLRWLRRETGFDASANARVAASDVGIADSLTLRDSTHGICGKPDYVVEVDRAGTRYLMPVEVKPTRRSLRLYESDRLQLGAYLLALRESARDRASSTGYVRYASTSFAVELNHQLEARVIRTARQIRSGRLLPVLHRDHSSVARCRACVVRHHCDESLAR